jgi:hypothetical protein
LNAFTEQENISIVRGFPGIAIADGKWRDNQETPKSMRPDGTKDKKDSCLQLWAALQTRGGMQPGNILRQEPGAK